jgi:hypothetical protein
MGIMWRALFDGFELEYERLLDREVGANCNSLLDVACGFNSPVRFLTTRPKRLVGIDACSQVIEQSAAKNIHDEYHNIGALDIEKQFGKKTFDCVLASDVLEHLTREDGVKLLSLMETVAIKKVIVFTPNGYLAQGEEYGNPLQAHLSGWTSKEMRDLGYRVIGVQGLKQLRKEMARIKWWPKRFWLMVSLLSQHLVSRYPRMAFRILCVKEGGGT